MKGKKQFQTYNDGAISVHMIDDDGNAGTIKEILHFEERTVGYKRYYEAMTAKIQVDRIVRVPFRPWLSAEYLAVINGEVYELAQVQQVVEAKPRSIDLSLHLSRQRRAADGTI